MTFVPFTPFAPLDPLHFRRWWRPLGASVGLMRCSWPQEPQSAFGTFGWQKEWKEAKGSKWGKGSKRYIGVRGANWSKGGAKKSKGEQRGTNEPPGETFTTWYFYHVVVFKAKIKPPSILEYFNTMEMTRESDRDWVRVKVTGKSENMYPFDEILNSFAKLEWTLGF